MFRKPMLIVALILSLVAILGFFAYRFLLLPAEFRAQANPAPACQAAMFDKSALIFDTLLICGTKEVPAEKLRYAAHVAAQWLDNDEDGQVDEPRLLVAMQGNKPVVIMSGKGIAALAFPPIMTALAGHKLQDLSAEETNPTGDRRDASQEEIHHIIMNAGWQALLPTTFSEQKRDNSTLYQAWKFADDHAYYVYNDPTCDDSCKVTEFVYLATAAYLGAEADLQSDELRLKTRQALQETIPSVIEIFEATAYVYPTYRWPDGSYPYPEKISFVGI